ncbi:hypothetical protein PMAYCL1PPCAC_14304, partial [Pristionchus mayeri]
SVVVGSLSLCSGLQYAMDEGYVDGGHAWPALIRVSLFLYTMPLYLAFINPRRSAVHRVVPDGPFTFVLPFGVVMGIVFAPGSLMDTVVRSNEFRAALIACSSLFVLSTSTFAVASATVYAEFVEI